MLLCTMVYEHSTSLVLYSKMTGGHPREIGSKNDHVPKSGHYLMIRGSNSHLSQNIVRVMAMTQNLRHAVFVRRQLVFDPSQFLRTAPNHAFCTYVPLYTVRTVWFRRAHPWISAQH